MKRNFTDKFKVVHKRNLESTCQMCYYQQSRVVRCCTALHMRKGVDLLLDPPGRFRWDAFYKVADPQAKTFMSVTQAWADGIEVSLGQHPDIQDGKFRAVAHRWGHNCLPRVSSHELACIMADMAELLRLCLWQHRDKLQYLNMAPVTPAAMAV